MLWLLLSSKHTSLWNPALSQRLTHLLTSQKEILCFICFQQPVRWHTQHLHTGHWGSTDCLFTDWFKKHRQMHEQIVFKPPACFCQKLCADQVILQDYEIVRLGVIMLIIHLHLHLNISEYFYVLLSSFYCTWIMVPPVQCSVQRSHFTHVLTCFTVISGRKWKGLKTWNFYELTVQNTLIYSASHKVHFTTWLENGIVNTF